MHERYREPGGEEAVFDAEARLLESLGHRVVRYEVHNDRVTELGAVRLATRTVWSVESHRDLSRIARELRPDVAHVHNTVPLLSPSVHHALRGAGVPVVQTLHNFRLLCPQGMLLRNGRPCHACLGRTPPLPGVVHACYRGSRPATAALAAMLTVHRWLGTWSSCVDAFVALSAFSRERFLEGGLPPDRVHVSPNFVDPDPGPGGGQSSELLYVGRLTPEKGVETLLEAWRIVCAARRGSNHGGHLADGAASEEAPRLRLIGDGPLARSVRDAAATLPGLVWDGPRPRTEVLERMGRARALVFPSLCYENSPVVVLEAFARGLPVLASRRGSTAELVRDGTNGRLFEPGDAEALAQALSWACSADGSTAAFGRLRAGARATYEARHTAQAASARLMGIYAAALASRESRPHA